MPVEDFFTEADLKSVEEAIRLAERGTSGEIRVHIEDTCPDNVLDHAAYIFSELEMHRTELRNGVLIYLAVDVQKMAIIGDAGIHQKVGGDFWNYTRELMAAHFQNRNFVQGISEGVLRAGEQLIKYFPVNPNDVNELSNEVTTGSLHDLKQQRRKS